MGARNSYNDPVVKMRKLPDLLTLSRGLVAAAIFSLGFVGARALEAVILLTILGWTTDILTGDWLANITSLLRGSANGNSHSTW